MFCGNTPIVHLAIDVLDTYVNNFQTLRRQTYPAWVIDRANKFRDHGIPTVWIDFWGEYERTINHVWKVYSRRLTNTPSGAHPLQYQLARNLKFYSAHDEDLVFLKGHQSTFRVPVLAEFLKERGCKTLLISGMNTAACVASSVMDAVDLGFNVVTLADCLADTINFANETQGGNPLWHAGVLRETLGMAYAPFVTCLDSKPLVERLEQGMTPSKAIDKQTEIDSFPGFALVKQLCKLPAYPVRCAMRKQRRAEALLEKPLFV